LVAVDALRLEPALRPAGAISCALELGDDALEAQSARVPEHNLAALGEVLAVFERAAVMAGEQPDERGLAVEQRGADQVDAVEVQQIEQVVLEAVAAALAQVGLQCAEI